MAFLHHKLTHRFLFTLVLFWSVVSFWFLNTFIFARALVLFLSFVSLIFVWLEISPIFLLIFLSFTSSYALYGYLFRYNLPVWLIMLAIFVIFGYIFTFIEQKIGILGNKRLEYLLLFSVTVLEIFIALSYFSINPLGLSLIIASVCYVVIGFCFAILARRPEERFSTYIWIAVIVAAAALLSSTWSMQ